MSTLQDWEEPALEPLGWFLGRALVAHWQQEQRIQLLAETFVRACGQEAIQTLAKKWRRQSAPAADAAAVDADLVAAIEEYTGGGPFAIGPARGPRMICDVPTFKDFLARYPAGDPAREQYLGDDDVEVVPLESSAETSSGYAVWGASGYATKLLPGDTLVQRRGAAYGTRQIPYSHKMMMPG